MITQYTKEHKFIAYFKDTEEIYKISGIRIDPNNPYLQHNYYWHLEYPIDPTEEKDKNDIRYLLR